MSSNPTPAPAAAPEGLPAEQLADDLGDLVGVGVVQAEHTHLQLGGQRDDDAANRARLQSVAESARTIQFHLGLPAIEAALDSLD